MTDGGQWTALGFSLPFHMEDPPSPLKRHKLNQSQNSATRNQVCMQFLNPPVNPNTRLCFNVICLTKLFFFFLSFSVFWKSWRKSAGSGQSVVCPELFLCIFSTHQKSSQEKTECIWILVHSWASWLKYDLKLAHLEIEDGRKNEGPPQDTTFLCLWKVALPI